MKKQPPVTTAPAVDTSVEQPSNVSVQELQAFSSSESDYSDVAPPRRAKAAPSAKQHPSPKKQGRGGAHPSPKKHAISGMSSEEDEDY